LNYIYSDHIISIIMKKDTKLHIGDHCFVHNS